MTRALGLALLACAGLAQAETSPDAVAWLQKVHRATQKLSYTGIFVYQQGERSETSRITRFVDNNDAIEKLEVLDGAAREVVRDRDSVKCYFPESRTVKVDRRYDRREFPALLPEELGRLEDNYTIALGRTRRIAGYECQEIKLAPRDAYRYSYRLCADARTGMPLKARVIDENGTMVEQFTFTQLTLGAVTRAQVKARQGAAGKWRVEESDGSPARLAEEGWNFGSQVLGYRKVAEMKRVIGKSRRVGQVVYSDGLAAISVFIEPADARRERVHAGLAGAGAAHLYTREIENHVLTAVGEAPAASVRRIADAVEYRGPR